MKTEERVKLVKNMSILYDDIFRLKEVDKKLDAMENTKYVSRCTISINDDTMPTHLNYILTLYEMKMLASVLRKQIQDFQMNRVLELDQYIITKEIKK